MSGRRNKFGEHLPQHSSLKKNVTKTRQAIIAWGSLANHSVAGSHRRLETSRKPKTAKKLGGGGVTRASTFKPLRKKCSKSPYRVIGDVSEPTVVRTAPSPEQRAQLGLAISVSCCQYVPCIVLSTFRDHNLSVCALYSTVYFPRPQ